MRDLIEILTDALSWMRRILTFKVRRVDGRDLKINLGCGLAVCPGWVNIDGSLNAAIAPFPRFVHRAAYLCSGANRYYTFADYHALLSGNAFFQANLAHGIPAESDSVDYVYSSHFVEHLYLREAERLVADCFRVMRPGGVIRIVVPDLDHALRLMAAGDRHKAMVSYFFVEDMESAYARHKYMYDFDLLSSLLHKHGFADVRRCEYRQGRVPDLQILDNRPDESLYVEAEKPRE